MSLLLNRKITFITAISAVLSLSAGINLPSHGDNAILQRISALNVPTDGRIWDFSQFELTGDEPEVRFDMIGDTCLSATLPGIRYDFELRGDTLYQVGTETHFVRLSDTIPLPYIVPSAGKDFSSRYASRGRAYHSEYIDAIGNVTLSDLGRGTVILPQGDTVTDVTLIRHSTRQLISAAFGRCPVADADSAMSLLRRTAVTYVWLAPDLPVPVAQITEVTDSVGNRPKGTAMRSAWICPPGNQPLRSVAARSSARRHMPSDSSSPTTYSPELTDLSVITDPNGVSVSGTSSGECRISMVLTDILGRVYASMPPTNYSRGSAVEWSCDDLPAGEYLLHIESGDSPSLTRKIIIK